MSTSWYGTLSVPTSMTEEDAIAVLDVATSSICIDHKEDLGPFHHVSIDDGIDVDLPSDDSDRASGFHLVEGRLHASLRLSNLERDVGEVVDETVGYAADSGLYDTRSQMEVYLAALTRICDAPVGTLVGSLMCEHDEGDASPLVVTPEGVRRLRSDGNVHRDYGFGGPNEHFASQTSVPADLLRREDAWHWEVDLVELKRRLRGIVVDGGTRSVLAHRS